MNNVTHDADTVERVARALSVAQGVNVDLGKLHPDDQTDLRNEARAALSAMPPQEVKPLLWADKGAFLEADNPLGGITLQAANTEQAANREAVHIARVQNALVLRAPQEVSVQEAARVLLDGWLIGSFEDGADALADDTFEAGNDSTAIIETWLRALSEKPHDV